VLIGTQGQEPAGKADWQRAAVQPVEEQGTNEFWAVSGVGAKEEHSSTNTRGRQGRSLL